MWDKIRRKIMMLGMSIVAVFAFAAVASASASAAEWLHNGEPISTPQATTVTSSGLRLTDENSGLFGETVTVECAGTGSGTVGPGGADTVASITPTNCKTVAGTCATSPTVSPLHLTWDTELVEEGGQVRDRVRNSGSGNPGWKVECLFGITDECTSNTGYLTITGFGPPTVTGKFEEKGTRATCTRTGKESGFVEGEVTISLTDGHELSIE